MHTPTAPRTIASPAATAHVGIERTWNFKQEDIVQHVEVAAGRKAFDISLPDLGPYHVDFTRSGRYMLLGGRRGHLAMMDWQHSKLVCEVQVCAGGVHGCNIETHLTAAAICCLLPTWNSCVFQGTTYF